MSGEMKQLPRSRDPRTSMTLADATGSDFMRDRNHPTPNPSQPEIGVHLVYCAPNTFSLIYTVTSLVRRIEDIHKYRGGGNQMRAKLHVHAVCCTVCMRRQRDTTVLLLYD